MALYLKCDLYINLSNEPLTLAVVGKINAKRKFPCYQKQFFCHLVKIVA